MGAFDGLHRGHQALIDRARTRGDRVALVTFDPHPAQVIAPGRVPRLLYAPEQRERVAASLNISALVLLPFDVAMSKLSPAEFARRYLAQGLRPSAVVVGADFRFGAQRAGDAATLRMLLASEDIDVEVVQPVPLGSDAPGKLSSTDIRRALDAGDVRRAGALLGRCYALAGVVEHGAKRGRELGFPTANLGFGAGYPPPLGIYASAMTVWDPASPDYGRLWPSVTSVGRNPTFNDAGAPVTVETHAIDQQLEERLYGVRIEVALIERLRDEAKYEGPEALVAQMHRDVARAKTVLTPTALERVLVPPARTEAS